MANQNNFVTNIADTGLSNTKYTVSRIIDSPTVNPLLEMEVPAEFLDFLGTHTVEMHVYSLVDNSLIYSEIISNNLSSNNPIEVKQYTYEDGARNLLFIDFSKVSGLFLPMGKYRVAFNFFVNELDTSAESPNLAITKISPSRREVEVKYRRPTSRSMATMTEFIQPSIKAEDVMNMLKQVFNQSGSRDIKLNMFTSSIDASRIETTLGPSASTLLRTYNFDANAPDTNEGTPYSSNLGVYPLAQKILDSAYPLVTQSFVTAIETHKSRSFTLEQLTGSVQTAIATAYNNLQNQELTFRFDLV